jgi:hypothetical protein
MAQSGKLARCADSTCPGAIAEHFNIGVAVADRWAAEDPDRTALRPLP